MSRHQAAARSPCGWFVVDARTASLGTDEPSGIVLKRTRATVWTVPVGLVAHVYHFSLTPFHSSGLPRLAGWTRSRNSTSCDVTAAVPVTRAAARPTSVLKN